MTLNNKIDKYEELKGPRFKKVPYKSFFENSLDGKYKSVPEILVSVKNESELIKRERRLK
ncbi:MAG: hypothetical protein ACXWFC_13840 [Nitrososphaeraceae archaeon]